MKAPNESGIKKGFPENATEWIATGGKRCTDVVAIGQRLERRVARSVPTTLLFHPGVGCCDWLASRPE